MERIINNRI